MRKTSVLAIGAHPDDIEYGCGGTLTRYRQWDHRISLLVLTAGEKGGSPEARQQEQVASAQILGAEEIFWGHYADTDLPDNPELILCIERILQQIRPDIVLVNFYDDTHQDHRNLAHATLSATRHIRSVLFYEVPSTRTSILTSSWTSPRCWRRSCAPCGPISPR
ncbi:MAG: PIG-L family deacetylase [Candidatus Tectomicrobia bacterium]|uniref:PIG-L family deacetylase n=1 Tax=Tectimicrobiota bacterium TaxID=2528274 RepID=A0A932FVZ2_UNCTE|nr:PIG-L family deacetylase [Candidatus Tectomicrobia bacterium]